MDARPALLATLLLLAGSAGCGGTDSHPASDISRPVTDERLRAAPVTREGWLSYGRDWSNRRYVPLSEINRQTVTGLRKLWQYDLRTLFRRSVHN